MAAWWEVYGPGRHLHIVTVRDADGALVGLAPLLRIPQRYGTGAGDRVMFIGSGSDVTPERLDFIVRRREGPPVCRAIVRYLLDDLRILEIDLRPFSSDSANTREVGEVLATAGGFVRRAALSPCPILILPDSVAQFVNSRSRNYRKKVGEYRRRCSRLFQARLRVSRSKDEVTRDLAALERLHLLRWSGASRAFRTPEYVAFHHLFAVAAFERGWLRLYSLECAGRPMAMIYCFSYGRRFYYYQAGRDPAFARERVGLLLMDSVIREAILEGATTFDFLSGQETYKYRWATGHCGNHRITFWRDVSTLGVAVCREAARLAFETWRRLARRRA
jgi:hypothetical protein